MFSSLLSLAKTIPAKLGVANVVWSLKDDEPLSLEQIKLKAPLEKLDLRLGRPAV